MDGFIINLAAIIAVLLPIFNVYAAFRLRRLSHAYPDVLALKDRWQASFFLAVSSIAGGLLGISRLYSITTGESLLPGFIGLVVILLVVLAPSVPNTVWVIRERRNHFDGPDRTAKVFDPATAIVIMMLIIGIGALASGKLVVPRFIYDRERERADRDEDKVEKLTDLLEDYNSQLRSLRRGQTDA